MMGRWGLSLELPGLPLPDVEPWSAPPRAPAMILGVPLTEPSVEAHVALVQSLAPSG